MEKDGPSTRAALFSIEEKATQPSRWTCLSRSRHRGRARRM